ncbi:MAG: hypothetical protein HRU21_09185 [Pseudomonadales bacterium]|nr:hypothetical protein [Pseudomonadales bacterium]
MRYEVNAVMLSFFNQSAPSSKMKLGTCFWLLCCRGGARTQKQPMKSISTMQKAGGNTKKEHTQKQKRKPKHKEKQTKAPSKSQQASKQASRSMPGRWQEYELLPQRVCCPWLCAMPVQHLQAPEQAREDTAPRKIDVTSNPPVGGISVVTLIRTDTTLDHSQKAEKV